jgi:hypothetical protein
MLACGARVVDGKLSACVVPFGKMIEAVSPEAFAWPVLVMVATYVIVLPDIPLELALSDTLAMGSTSVAWATVLMGP